MFGYGLYEFFRNQHVEEKEIHHFEEEKISPEMGLGYGRSKFYTPEITIRPDLAILYKYRIPLELNQVGLQGVWFVERDRIISLSDDSILSVKFKAPRLFVEMSGKSELPVKIEIDGRPIGEIQVNGEQDYEIVGGAQGYSPHLLTMYIPRGIYVYSLKFTEG